MRLFNLDLLAKGSFQTAPDGQQLFFPNGLAGKGYIIESAESYRRLFRQQKHWGLSIMLIISALVWARVGWHIMLPLFVVLNLLKQVVVHHTTRQMQVSEIPYSLDGFFREGLRLPKMSHNMLAFLAGAGVLIGLTCLATIAWQLDLWRKLLGWGSVAALIAYLAIRELRGQNNRETPHPDPHN